MSPYRERYRNELEELKIDAERLVEEVIVAVAKSVDALRDYDVEKARQVIRYDQIVNDLNLRVEKRCMQLLALQQPMAKDLRLIVTTLKIGIDLERIGDLAVDIARIVVTPETRST
jgi:phosphate transport system protein